MFPQARRCSFSGFVMLRHELRLAPRIVLRHGSPKALRCYGYGSSKISEARLTSVASKPTPFSAVRWAPIEVSWSRKRGVTERAHDRNAR